MTHPTSPARRPRQRGRLRIAVVGASLTGPAAALLLHQAGLGDVRLYDATPAGATLGGGVLSLEHSALDVLDRLGIGQHEYVHLPSETIWHTPVTDRQPGAPVRRHYPGRFTTWTQLHAALMARIPAGMLHSGRRVTGLTEHRGRPLLHLAGGHTEPADLVVFADGRASTGRRLLDPGRRLRYVGYLAHRGTAAGGSDLSDFWRLEPGPGAQFNIAPVPGGADWTLYADAPEDTYARLFGAGPHDRPFAHARHVTADARRHADDLATLLLPPEHAAVVHGTTDRAALPVMDIDPPTTMAWPVGDGHAVLLGDALAPVRAHTARGANNGIEQAAGLAAVVRQHLRHGADLTTALTGWQRRHLPAAVAAVRLGAVIGARVGLGTGLATPPVPAAAR